MRFNSLHLLRYGHFNNLSLNFAQQAENSPDLHVIYGRNEAGKSTISNAIIDFIFGISSKTQYDFMHGKNSMEIAADVNLSPAKNKPETSESIRLKRLIKQLRDYEDKVVDTNTIDTHNLSRDDYISRFWFDDQTLHEGGESILNNRGELGAALFAATTGLNTLTNQLDEIMAPTNTFYYPGRQKNIRIVELKQTLKEIQKVLKQHQTNKTAWSKLVKQHKQQQLAMDEATATLIVIRNKAKRISTVKSAFDRYKKWKTLQRELENSTELLDISEQSVIEFSELKQNHRELTLKLDSLVNDINSVELRLTEIPNLKTWKSFQTELNTLRTSSDHYHNERARLLEVRSKYEALCHKISKDSHLLPANKNGAELAAHILTDELIETVDSNLVEWHAISTTLGYLTEQKKNTNSAISQLDVDLTHINQELIGPDIEHQLEVLTKDIKKLDQYLVSNELDNLVQECKQQNKIATQLSEEAQEQKLKLASAGIHEDIDLHSLAVPSSTSLQQAVDDRKDLHNKIQLEKTNIRNLKNSIRKHNDKLEQLGFTKNRNQNIHTSALYELEENWSVYVSLLEKETDRSELIESAKKIDTNITQLKAAFALTVENAEKIGSISSTLQILQEDSTSLVSTIAHCDELQDQYAKLVAIQDKLLEATPQLTFEDAPHLLSWNHELNVWRSMDRKRISQLKTLEKFESQARTKSMNLAETLNNISFVEFVNNEPIASSLPTTLTLARDAQKQLTEKWNKLEDIRKSRHSLMSDMQSIDNKLVEAYSKEQTIKEETKQLLASASLKIESIEILSARWTQIKSNNTVMVQQIQLQAEIEIIESNLKEIESSIQLLITSLSLEDSGDAAKNLFALVEYHDIHLDYQAKHSENSNRLDEFKNNLNRCQAEISTLNEHLQPIHDKLKTQTIEELQQKLTDTKMAYDTLKRQKLLEEDICELMGTDRFIQARVELDDSHTRMEQEIAAASDASGEEFDITASQINQHLAQKLTEYEVEESLAQNALTECQVVLRETEVTMDDMGQDERVAELRQKEADIIHEIEDGVLQAMKLRLGRIAIERGLQHFRDQNQSSMLIAAKQSFASLTEQKYTDLITRPDEKGVERLITTRNTGESVLAKNLSMGTRYQLYLSLRIAAYHEYSKHRRPLPFIADDIFETFDEPRTERALIEFAQMANKGQVIYFTHHSHVANIAHEVVPNVNVINI